MEKLKLEYPINYNGQTINELNVRRSKIKDRLAISFMKCSDEEKEVRLFANLAEVTPDVIKELDESDYKEFQNLYLSFFKSAATSEKQ